MADLFNTDNPGDVRLSGKKHDALMASDVSIGNREIVMLANPGTATGATPGATTATARFLGISLEAKVNPASGTERVSVDTGGAVAVMDVTDTLNADGRAAGQTVIMAGRRTVTLGTGVRQCGVILEVLEGGAGTSKALVQFYPFGHTDISS
jgi:hypothetical protein